MANRIAAACGATALALMVLPGAVAQEPAPFGDASLVSECSRALSARVIVRVRPGVAMVQVADGRFGVAANGTDRAQVLAVEAVLNSGPVHSVRPMLRVAPAMPGLAASLGLDRDVVIEVRDAAAARSVGVALESCASLIEFAQPEGVGALADGSSEQWIPTDPYFALQYGLRNTGQAIQGAIGLPGADIEVPLAWELAPPKRSVVVAVLDSGVAPHPELFTRLVPGFNTQTMTTATGDEIASHGTHIAGIIAAVSGNGVGIAGVAPNAYIMPVKVTNSNGTPGVDWLINGIIWAADHGANILNISISWQNPSSSLQLAIQYASIRGCLIVCSAGNTPGVAIGAPGRYPEVIAVGATDNRDMLWGSSTTGPELDLVAPGVNVYSTWHQWFLPYTYRYGTGTSQAVPHVVGVAALVMGANPDLTPTEVRGVLEASADDLGAPGWDPVFGHGRVNAARAVQMALALIDPQSLPTGECLADLNHDGKLTSDDLFIFVAWYVAKDPRADLAAPVGTWDGSDFFEYIKRYAEGCPG